MAVARAVPLLICSVGNPGSAYANTLHSAGHTVLKKLSERLEFQPYQKSRPLGSGLVSKPLAPSDADWTLWQSTSLMNVSGKGVRAAHNAWAQDKPDGEGRLVIVHDELEKLRQEAQVESFTELTKDMHMYPDFHGTPASRS